MILASDSFVHTSEPNWQQQLKNMLRTPEALLAAVGLGPEWLAAAQQAHALFPVRVTQSFVNRMQPGNIEDPLLRQVMPLAEELLSVKGYSNDPLDENQYNSQPGILHKYQGRALLISTSACAIHCRYCFRRHFPYQQQQQSRSQWQSSLSWLANRPEINEIILSGGDPLMLDTPMLAHLGQCLRQYPQIKRLRFHSRLPIVLPDRIDDELLAWLSELPWQLVMVIHSNHANELCDQTLAALGRLRQAGMTLLNQTVLLRGINDEVSSLRDLSERLFSAQVLPYYLHCFDPVQGASHFDVSDHQGRALVARLADQLPGYLVPKLVREVPGTAAKQPR